jgi:hypothetical protein
MVVLASREKLTENLNFDGKHEGSHKPKIMLAVVSI